MIIDDDIIISSDFIDKHFMNYRDPTIAAVSGQTLELNQKPTDELSPQFHRRHTGWMHFPLNFSKRTEVMNLTSGNMSIKKKIILEAGGFDENMSRAFFNDGDLANKTM